MRLFDYALQPPAVRQLYQTTSAPGPAQKRLPARTELEQNYPNPFNPSTTIRFTLSRSGAADLRVTDLLGRTVMLLVAGRLEAGRHEVAWDAAALPSGCYFITLSSEGVRITHRALLLK